MMKASTELHQLSEHLLVPVQAIPSYEHLPLRFRKQCHFT